MSGIGHASQDRSLSAAHRWRPILANLSAGICALAVVLYQSWFMPFFLPFFMGRDEFARLVFHALYGSVLIVSFAVLVVRRDVRKAIVPLAIAAAMAVAPVVLHPVGIVAKCYLITLFLGGAAIVMMLASSPATVLRLSASATALSAVICFLDLCFANGFTNTPGRAAGLAINPNVAAAGLLLGAAASYGAVAQKWRASFLVLVGAALLATLSRSTLLAAFAAVAAPIAVRLWQRFRNGRQFQIDLRDWARAIAVAFALLVAIGIASLTNNYFRVAVGESLGGVLSLNEALNEASAAVDTSLTAASPPRPGTLPPTTPAASFHADLPGNAVNGPSSRQPEARTLESGGPASPKAPSDTGAMPVPASNAMPSSASSSNSGQSPSASKMQALGERLTDEGVRNSISARALFLERGLLAYREGGFFGRGLEEAQALAPHNSFVLFAIAFGHLGWLVPIGLVGFAFCFVRDARDLPLGVAVLGVMLTSHDVLLTPSLFLPVALGIGGMLAVKAEPAQNRRTGWSFAAGTVGGAALFVAGCVAILALTPQLSGGRLQNEAMFTSRGGYGARLPAPSFPGLFQFDDLPASQASYLREDGTPLRRVNWSAHSWPAVRQGEYTFRQRDTVLFAATDISDPRQNGRTYEVAVPLAVSALCFIVLGTILAWSIATAAACRGYLPRTD
ncbi:hypothetical protein EOA32_28410 [Mesorhizobium sp. M1A.F.Ca.ET.072.01.1.1]|uniref:hypothetical protein n=1 Tax=Mesorhizobium sp. M1A.F.Ca.ET.072.01.1.1 TaxID=2496753 RepID=UPI000FD2CABB|nr:hypothetical protein [Mesorhizobium sp. M1A.F.Ca.ET.072.01.1.1]RUW47583.1 hypothetical protein EOA32_28410 [Mesorhizobium sp. M1A.F.Ca.ET.072.01.1.1]TIV04176.1 MAG: hypothetical protein E5W04_04835 [Mesorhizobium sp.]